MPRWFERVTWASRAERLLADLAARDEMSARGIHRVLRVARTIADLGGSATVSDDDLLAAAGLRDPGASAPLAA